MDFLLYQVVARVVAVYLAIDTYRTIQRGLAEGKISSFNPDWLDWFTYVNNRETHPTRFWLEIFIQTTILIGCIVVAIFGWFR
jgi:hypothetical protein